jgi:hypothetical protein
VKKIPAKTVKQRKFLGIALAIKRGKLPKSYSPEAAKAAETMSKKALEHFAGTKEKNLPERKRKKK